MSSSLITYVTNKNNESEMCRDKSSKTKKKKLRRHDVKITCVISKNDKDNTDKAKSDEGQ